MNDHYLFTDTEFVDHFTDCTLDPRLFAHEAHLRLAWVLVRTHGVEQASEQLCEAIARFDRTVGDGTKFNRTITIASARIMAHFAAFIAEFPHLRHNFRELLDAHRGA